MTTDWQDKNCGCYIDADEDDKRIRQPYVVRCMLHEFAEKAAKLLNKMLKDEKVTANAWHIMEAQNVLDNYGLLEE